MKIVLLGNNKAAINVLSILLKRDDDLLIFTPYKKKIHSWHDSLYDYAISKGITETYNSKDINSPPCVDKIKRFQPDYLISVYYDQIIKDDIISSPKKCCINIHPSLLPKYAGTSPLIWAIINGEEKTGVTIHQLMRKVDMGDVFMQEEIPITPDNTGYNLHLETADKVKEMFEHFILNIGELIDNAKPQIGKRTYYSYKHPRKNHITGHDSAKNINNIVRALTQPLPGAYMMYQEKNLYLWDCSIVKDIRHREKTSIGDLFTSPNKKHLYVKCLDGFIEIENLNYYESDMTGKEFIKRFLF